MTHLQETIVPVIRQPSICFIVAPDDNGNMAWYFIDVEPSKMQQFTEDMFENSVNLSDYGVVIEHGKGVQPPQYVIDRLYRRYNYVF